MTEVCCSSARKRTFMDLRKFTITATFIALVPCVTLATAMPALGASRSIRSDGVYNASEPPFNAKGNGRDDDYRAIQSAINAACAQKFGRVSGAKVYLPPGVYNISEPLLLHCSGLTLSGVSQNSTILKPTLNQNTASGPLLNFVSSDYPRPKWVPALLTGSGRAWRIPPWGSNPWNSYFIDLRAVPDVDLNGLSAFTAEFSVKLSTIGDDAFMGSTNAKGSHRAFEIFSYNGNLYGTLTAGGVRHTLSTSWSPATRTVYHIALDYDGHTIRLFLNGNMVASQGASGPVNQDVSEDVKLGYEGGPGSYAFVRMSTGGFTLDSVRLSKVARYTSNFSRPTAKFSNDSNTLALLNFDRNPTIFTVAQSQGGSAFLAIFYNNYPAGAINHVQISDLQVQSGGILSLECSYCTIRNTHIVMSRIGIQWANNSMRGAVYDTWIEEWPWGWIDMLQEFTSSPQTLNHIQLTGGDIGIYAAGGGAWTQIYDDVSTTQVYPFYFAGASTESDIVCTACDVDFEPGGSSRGSSAALSDVYLDGVQKVTFIGGVLEEYNGQPMMIVNGGGELTFVGTEFNSTGSNNQGGGPAPPEMIHIVNMPSSPVLLINPQLQSPARLTNKPSAVSVIPQKKGRGSILGAGLRAKTLKAPQAPFVQASGSGSSYTYYLIGHDFAGNATPPSRGTTVTGGRKPNNKVCAKPQAGVYYFDVLRGDASHTVGTIGPFHRADTDPDFCLTDTVASPLPYKLKTTNTAADPVAPVMLSRCAGRTRLFNGQAVVTDSCVTGSRPTGCTDNSSKHASACSAIPSSGRVVLHGTGSDDVSWFQM